MAIELVHFVRELFPSASPELQQLFQGAIEQANPLALDFLSIRDLVEEADCRDCEAVHALLLLLFLALAEGSLCVERSQPSLTRRLAELVDADSASRWAQRIVAETTIPAKLLGSGADHAPLLQLEREGRSYVYFHKYLRAERSLHDVLQRRLAHPASAANDWQPILHDVLNMQPLRVGGQPLTLDRDQQLALGLALTRDFVIVSGGPGTGKTSLVLTLLRCLVRCGVKPEQIALAAPTGRAAQRLVDALRTGLDRLEPPPDSPDALLRELASGTLHQLLEYHPKSGQFRRHEENSLQADVVIVDEVSMVGVVLMAQLLRALRPETKLILLGDKDQLPSVDAGAVLASLVPGGTPNAFPVATWSLLRSVLPAGDLDEQPGEWPDHLVMLRSNHRSQPGIRMAAQAINRQDCDEVERLPVASLPTEKAAAAWDELERLGGCYRLPTTSPQPGELRQVLQSWADGAYSAEYVARVHACDLASDDEPRQAAALTKLFDWMERCRVLTLLREGAWGCVGINQFLDRLLRPKLDLASRGGLFAGAPVLITANDHARGLFNGDVGLTLRSGANLRVVFRRSGSFVSFAAESLTSRELGFALTVHKSQGSEYERVLVVLPPASGRRLLTKEILYTAVTRARRLAVLCGAADVLRHAVSRRIVRESALGFSEVRHTTA